MHASLLELIACPDCNSDLELRLQTELFTSEQIATGELLCSGCARVFPIKNGIPRLLPIELVRNDSSEVLPLNTAAHFAHEFTALAEQDADLSEPEVLEYYFYSRTGLDPQLYDRLPGNFYRTSLPAGPDAYRPDGAALHGKTVLDAGCGPGRFLPVAAASAKRVIGLDLGPHIERAGSRCSRLANVDLVQGSVLKPPFKLGVFDFIYSVGVLHHTPDPRGGCQQLAALLAPAPESALSIWVYPPEYWGGRIRGWVNRFVNRRLSAMPPEKALNVCANWLYPLGRLQMVFAKSPWLKALAAPLFLVSVPRHPSKAVMIATIYDYFGPQIISTHSDEEVRNWLESSGLQNLRKLPIATGWYARGRVPHPDSFVGIDSGPPSR